MSVSVGPQAAGGNAATPTAAIGTTVAAVAVLTGWGHGIGALPADATRAAAGRAVIPLGRPTLEGDRFRRATRECLLGVAAVDALLRENDVSRDAVRGSSTALIYVTGGAYGASNQAFVVAESVRPASVGAGSARPGLTEGGLSEKRAGSVAGPLHFPYTAPSAMAGEVAIEFGLTGPYGILIGGAAATIDALWQATRLLAGGRCERALVLAVETFEECADLYARGRWLVRRPLVEAAACALLVPGALHARYDAPRAPSALETLARARAGETLACAPLIALALARDGGATASIGVTGEWRGRRAGLYWRQ
ncbi:MAG TPA: beta-ketoacyl synthase N-terminal-like domain-containing protein [Candidatus Binatia bacterium]|nr:beta-ketoacyl synthase N-terminal-like domain-containing protein [Candidatus Binatia bacterium]